MDNPLWFLHIRRPRRVVLEGGEDATWFLMLFFRFGNVHIHLRRLISFPQLLYSQANIVFLCCCRTSRTPQCTEQTNVNHHTYLISWILQSLQKKHCLQHPDSGSKWFEWIWTNLFDFFAEGVDWRNHQRKLWSHQTRSPVEVKAKGSLTYLPRSARVFLLSSCISITRRKQLFRHSYFLRHGSRCLTLITAVELSIFIERLHQQGEKKKVAWRNRLRDLEIHACFIITPASQKWRGT